MLSRLRHAREHEARRHFREIAGEIEAQAVRPACDRHRALLRRREVAKRGSEAEEDLHDDYDGVDEPEKCAERARPVVFAEGAVDLEAQEEPDCKD